MINLFVLFFIPVVILLVLLLVWLQMRRSGFRAGGTPVLQLYSRNLTDLAAKNAVDPVIGREEEIERVAQILSRRTKNNPVLIGESGVGKTAIVEGLARLIAEKKVPHPLLGKRVLQLDLGSLVAGTKYRGEFEMRLKSLTDELIKSERSIILFIDELQTLAEAGEATGAIDAANILKPPLARGELQVIGATTPQEYQAYIEKDHTLERRFQPILISEPSHSQTLAILKGLRKRYEDYHHVKISDKALEACVDLADDCLPDRVFPDKSIDLMDEASAFVAISLLKKGKKVAATVGPKEIQSIIKHWQKNRLCFPKRRKS